MAGGTPAQADKNDLRGARVQKWIGALERMIDAQRLLDESRAPPEVGAELDQAIEHLKVLIAKADSGD